MIEGLFQPIHLVLILAIIMIVFGAGKLPEMGGAVGRGIREFRKEVHDATDADFDPVQASSVGTASTNQTTQTAAFCTTCGERLPKDARFCPGCGATTATEVTPAAALPVEVESTVVQQESPTA